MMTLRTVLLAGLAVAGATVGVIAVALAWGAWRWQAQTAALFARLEAARTPMSTRVFDPAELTGLPPPVERYLRIALAPGQPIVEAVRIGHAGSFNMSESGASWRPFTSQQRVVTRRPGFVWDGRVAMLPGLCVHVHDAYVAGEGILHPAIAGLFTLADMRGTPEVATGELMRYFAEAAWYPTALLPSQGVRWTPIDANSADATLTDGAVTLTLKFRFNESGLIESVRAQARGRTVQGQVIPTPWEGRWSNYVKRDGMTVPLEGEVAWLTPEGRQPYWRGRVESLSYEFVR
jgi:hypothetical protein